MSEPALLPGEELRFLAAGKVKHVTFPRDGSVQSLCGIRPQVWRTEPDRLARLRLCNGCRALMHTCLVCEQRATHRVASLDHGLDGYLCHEHQHVPVAELVKPGPDAQEVRYE